MDNPGQYDQLQAQLELWDKRRRLRDGLIQVPRGMLLGLLAAVVVAAISRMRPWLHNDEMALVAATMALLGALAGLVSVLARRQSPLEQARLADWEFQLSERMSTAVEIQEGGLSIPRQLVDRQLNDALSVASSINISRKLALTLDRRDWLFIIIAGALLVTSAILPNLQSQTLKRRQAIAESIEEQISSLEQLREEIREEGALTEQLREELLEPVENALQELDAAELSQERAVAALSEAEADLRALSETTSVEDLRRALQEAGSSLADSGAGEALGGSLQQGELSGAAAAAAQLAESLDLLSNGEVAELADGLAASAASLADVDSQLSQALDGAAQSLRDGERTGAAERLRDAAGTLQQRALESAVSQRAAEAADQLNQGRQAVAQAGDASSGGADGTAEGAAEGQGQGQGSGQGSGQGAGAGSGSSSGGSSGTGSGTGSGGGSGGGLGQQTEQGSGVGGPGAGGGHAEHVFVPPYTDLSGEAGVNIELPAECLANPSECGGLLSESPTEFTSEGSAVPYSQVFGDYRNAAYEALADDYIPLGLKGYVRDYFSSLEP
jgi:hypothetical protein